MLKGSCLCKAVTYTLDEELSELVFCHCSFCRKATASDYTVNAKVSSKKLVLHGKENLVSYSSSPGKQRYYCQNCHSQIFTVQENIPEVCALKLGTIDESDQNLQTVPKRHIFQDPAFSWLLEK